MSRKVDLLVRRELPEPETLGFLVDEETLDPGGFLARRSRKLRIARGAEAPSRPFVYDEVARRALDAVVVVPFFRREGELFVVLRTAFRPPVALRAPVDDALPREALGALWEFPAGLVEPSESTGPGLRRAALRELAEETGFRPPETALIELGRAAFPAPGVIAEAHFFFAVEVEPESRGEPELDGSPLEEYFELVAVPLPAVLAAARAGRLRDGKTELAARRLAEEES